MCHKKSMKNWEKKLDKVKGFISIARKAGYAILGGENLLSYDKKLFLVILDFSAGKSLKREINFFCKNRGLTPVFVDNLEELVGIENIKTIGIKNKKIAENIEGLLKGE